MYECSNLFWFFLNFTLLMVMIFMGLNRTDGGDGKGLYVRFKEF